MYIVHDLDLFVQCWTATRCCSRSSSCCLRTSSCVVSLLATRRGQCRRSWRRVKCVTSSRASSTRTALSCTRCSYVVRCVVLTCFSFWWRFVYILSSVVTEVSDCCWQGLYAMSMNCLDSAEAQFKTALSVSRNLYVNSYSKQCCHLVFIKYNYYIWIWICSYHATKPSARLSVSIWLSCLYVWSDKRNLYRSSKTLTLISWRSGEHIATPACWHLCSCSLRKTGFNCYVVM